MLTEDGCLQRQQNLWAALPDATDWTLIADPRHVQYFCGFRPNPISFSADCRSALLLQRDGSGILFADNFTRRTALADVFASEEVITPWYDHRHSVINRDHALREAVMSKAKSFSAGRGMIETEAVPAHLLSVLPEETRSRHTDDEISLGTVVRSLRRRKLPDELVVLQRCMDAGAAGHAAAFDAVRPGATDLDVYLAVQLAAQRAAGSPCVVYGDFRATNAEHCKAGGLPVGERLEDGDLFILDYSVVIAGYRSDFTNTIAVGRPAPAQMDQAAACLEAIDAAETALAPGISCADIFKVADDTLKRRGFDGLSHHAGHGLGMEHPEPPILVAESTDVLMAGDVVTIEPGLYIEGTGGMRFEHNYEITETGANRMSHHVTALQILS